MCEPEANLAYKVSSKDTMSLYYVYVAPQCHPDGQSDSSPVTTSGSVYRESGADVQRRYEHIIL